ncbi:MAG: UvrD-helicase domain-containing protein [Leuconostoc mesenteroides]
MRTTEIEDAKERTQAIKLDGNALILASAGTGKTHLIIQKLVQLAKNNNSFKKLAVITYTDKAANELKARVENRDIGSRVVSQTMHNWIMNEIITPFVNNCYILPTDIPIKYSFKTEISGFEEGIQHIQKNAEIGSDRNKKKDFAFQLALKILSESNSAQRYLKATYSWIFVDEYQDVNGNQHALIKFIVEKLKIKAFIVGDNKQQIFNFRGSDTAYLEDFMDDQSFTQFELTHNFRSNQEIVAYSRLFDDKYIFSSGYSQFTGEAVINVNPHKNSLNEIVNKIKSEKTLESILILKTTNNSIEELKQSDAIFDNFQTKVRLTYAESIHSDIFSLLIRILYRYEGIYSLQKYIEEALLHKNFSHISNIIEKFNNSGDLEAASQLLQLVGIVSEMNFSQDEAEMFSQVVSDDGQVKYVLGVAAQYMILTVHGAKGLEADHVIVDPSEFLFDGRFDQQKHYVAITRAKKKLWLMNDNLTYKNIVKVLVQKDSELPSET